MKPYIVTHWLASLNNNQIYNTLNHTQQKFLVKKFWLKKNLVKKKINLKKKFLVKKKNLLKK